MEFMPGPRTEEDYFVYGPPNYSSEDILPSGNPKGPEFTQKYKQYKPVDSFNDALSEGEMIKGRNANVTGAQFLDPNNPVPTGASPNIQNLMKGLRGQPMRFNSSNVDNGTGFNNDSDFLEIGPGYVSAGGRDVTFSAASDGISAQVRPGQTGLSGDISFNPGFNGAPESVSGGVRYTSPDRRFNAGIRANAAERQSPTFRGNIGYNTENGGISAEGGIDAQGMPDVQLNFNAGQPQLLPEQIEAMKAGVPNVVDTALGYNDTLMPQPPQPANVDTRSAGQRFRDQYIKNKYGGIENLPLR